MPLPGNADVIVTWGYWLDEATGLGVRTPSNTAATITFDPVFLGDETSTRTPNVRDLTAHTWIKTRQRVATVDATTGYFAVLLVASNDPDLDAYGGRKVTFLGETPFTVAVPYDAPEVTVDATMHAVTGLAQGSTVRGLPLVQLAVVVDPPPQPESAYLTDGQTYTAIADAIEMHDADVDAHGGGGGGGVTSGQLAAAVTAHVDDLTPHPVYDDLASLSLLFENGLV